MMVYICVQDTADKKQTDNNANSRQPNTGAEGGKIFVFAVPISEANIRYENYLVYG